MRVRPRIRKAERLSSAYRVHVSGLALSGKSVWGEIRACGAWGRVREYRADTRRRNRLQGRDKVRLRFRLAGPSRVMATRHSGCARKLMLLFILLTVWAVLLIAVCAVCAAGGRADEGRDRWYGELQKRKAGSDKEGKDAA